jgi:hypothetical protein
MKKNVLPLARKWVKEIAPVVVQARVPLEMVIARVASPVLAHPKKAVAPAENQVKNPVDVHHVTEIVPVASPEAGHRAMAECQL